MREGGQRTWCGDGGGGGQSTSGRALEYQGEVGLEYLGSRVGVPWEWGWSTLGVGF